MEQTNQNVITHLRQMARCGDSVATMFREVKNRLGDDVAIVTILDCFRSAFCLSLAEVKPVAALSRNDRRNIEDDAQLEELIRPSIKRRRKQWDVEIAKDA